jgi:hypothetical protein
MKEFGEREREIYESSDQETREFYNLRLCFESDKEPKRSS